MNAHQRTGLIRASQAPRAMGDMDWTSPPEEPRGFSCKETIYFVHHEKNHRTKWRGNQGERNHQAKYQLVVVEGFVENQ